MLECEGDCGAKWLDNVPGCQQLDADAFCKLQSCDKDAFARSYAVTLVRKMRNQLGFTCQGFGKTYSYFGMTEFQFGKIDQYYEDGDAVTNVSCQKPTKNKTFGN